MSIEDVLAQDAASDRQVVVVGGGSATAVVLSALLKRGIPCEIAISDDDFLARPGLGHEMPELYEEMPSLRREGRQSRKKPLPRAQEVEQVGPPSRQQRRKAERAALKKMVGKRR